MRNQLTTHRSTDRISIMVFADSSGNINQDYYAILGIKRDATKQEIHKAFRQLAKKYHPDKNKDKGASDEFMKIFKAYETLSDEKKRKEYDDQLNGQAHVFHNWHQTTASPGMGDFDINEFFRQYEDQFMRHAQFFNQHQQHHDSHHEKVQFHGINLDELFHDIDQDEYNSFGRLFELHNGHNHNHFRHHIHSMGNHLGDGDTYFGNLYSHQSLHDHQHNHQVHYGGQRAGMGGSYPCKTITKQFNGMVMTQTSCA